MSGRLYGTHETCEDCGARYWVDSDTQMPVGGFHSCEDESSALHPLLRAIAAPFAFCIIAAAVAALVAAVCAPWVAIVTCAFGAAFGHPIVFGVTYVALAVAAAICLASAERFQVQGLEIAGGLCLVVVVLAPVAAIAIVVGRIGLRILGIL